jgi:hypothetical protein
VIREAGLKGKQVSSWRQRLPLPSSYRFPRFAQKKDDVGANVSLDLLLEICLTGKSVI